MDPDIVAPTLLLFFALLAANAFFVAAEFSLIGVRRSRLQQLVREGDLRAARVLSALDRPEELALVAQLGSSASALTIGLVTAHIALAAPWLNGVATVSPGWQWLFAPAISVAVAVIVVACVHVIICEQIPKIIGIQRAEWVAGRLTTRPLQLMAILLAPLVWLLSRVVTLLSRTAGLTRTGFHPLVHTPEEIRLLVAQSHEQGVVEQDEREMIHGIFEFSETVAREVMTPRPDMIAVPVDISLEELVALVTSEGHSRLPVFDGTIDNIVGVLLTKDVLPVVWERALGNGGPAPFSLRSLLREPYFVPDTKAVDDLLAEFRQHSVHLAIVVDEFGGTYGLVTMEDLLEEIVGEINDEYDVAEEEFEPTPEGDVLIDGGAQISEVNERFHLELPDADFDTIGGFIFGALGRVPEPGDVVEVPGTDPRLHLLVEEVEERRVTRVRLTRVAPAAAPDENAPV
jgi:CBS domain containing-hemolysin-like protein